MLCSKCGQDHPLDEIELTFRRPDDAAKLSPKEREKQVQENSDLCIISGQRFFIRALLPLPVIGRSISYNIGLWVEVSKTDFERVYELWDSDEQVNEPPIQSIVANEIPITEGALGHPALLQLTGPTTRPTVLLKTSAQPIYLEQSAGIDSHKAYEYSSLCA